MKRPLTCLLLLFALVAGSGCMEDLVDKQPVLHIVVTGNYIDTLDHPVPGLEVSVAAGLRIDDPWAPVAGPVLTDVSGAFRLEGTLTDPPYLLLKLTARQPGSPNEITFFISPGSLYNAKLEEKGDKWEFGPATVEMKNIRWNPR